MDWKTIKNIMIISLIFLNLFLGYNIYFSVNRFARTTSVETEIYKKVLNVLEDRNIFVNVELDSYQSMVSSVSLEYESYGKDVTENFFGNYQYEDLGNIFIDEKSFIRITDNVELQWFMIDPGNEQNYTTSINAEKIADEFLRDHGYYSDDMVLWKIYFNKGNVVVEYRQEYDGFFLDPSYMTLEINNSNVVSFSRKWFSRVSEDTMTMRKVISPSEALFKLIESDEISEMTLGRNEKILVEKIELGYKLDDSIFFSSIMAGDALPYWRISFGNDDVIYIEAIKQ